MTQSNNTGQSQIKVSFPALEPVQIQGPDLVETNSRMVHSGEVSCKCIIDGSTLWQKDVQLFLFDQSLVICKKDLIKKNHYLFRDRISLNSATFIDCKDGKGLYRLQGWFSKTFLEGPNKVVAFKNSSC